MRLASLYSLVLGSIILAGCGTSSDEPTEGWVLAGLVVILLAGALGALSAFLKFYLDNRREKLAFERERKRRMQPVEPELDTVPKADPPRHLRPELPLAPREPEVRADYSKPAFTPPPPPPPPPGSLRSIRPDDAAFREAVAGALSFEAPNLERRKPFRMRTHTTVEEEFEALQFKPGAVLFEGLAIVESNGSTIVGGVLPFLQALHAAGVPLGFVFHERSPSVVALFDRFGPVVQGPPPVGPLFEQAAQVLGVSIDQCAAVVSSAASIKSAREAECLTLGFSAHGPALALAQADLLVNALRTEWIQSDGSFRME